METKVDSKDVEIQRIVEFLIEKLSIGEREWWTLRECCLRKGIHYKTICNRKNLQPNGGIPDGKVGGRNVWHRETLEQWVLLTDDMMEVKNGK